MSDQLSFQFYYGGEAEQYSFYRIPRVLIIHPYFKCLSSDSKLLYGLLLDRMGLSLKNDWMDKSGKVFIYYSLEEIQKDLSCGHEKAIKLLAELDTGKGIGLIERIKQGQGKPARIYVKRFAAPELLDGDSMPPPEDVPQPEVQTSEKQKSESPVRAEKPLDFQDTAPAPPTQEAPPAPVPRQTKPQKSEKPHSRLRKTRSQDLGKTDPSNTYVIQPYLSQLYTSPSMPPGVGQRAEDRAQCRKQLKRQLSCPVLYERFSTGEVDNLVELLVDALCTTRPTLRVNSEEVPVEAVRKRLSQLDFSHIEYAFDYLSHRTQPVGNLRGFLLTLLYNAPTTMEQYYDLEVQQDFGESTGLHFAAQSA